MIYLRFTWFFILIFLTIIFSGCEKELKEHPLPPELKKQLEIQSNPSLQGKSISGTISVAPELVEKIPPNARLFIIARPEGAQGGPPMAVKRLSGPELPYVYNIGQADTMLEGIMFEGKIDLTVRLDQDGNAKAGPGDIEGRISAMAGDENVDIVLDRIIGEG